MPASGTEKSFSPAPPAASSALAASLQGLGVPMLADASDEADEAEADAVDEDAEEDADAADEDCDETEAELLLPPETDVLLEELLEHPTTPIASTAAKAMASNFLFMMTSLIEFNHCYAFYVKRRVISLRFRNVNESARRAQLQSSVTKSNKEPEMKRPFLRIR